METLKDTERFGSPLGAEWGPAMGPAVTHAYRISEPGLFKNTGLL